MTVWELDLATDALDFDFWQLSSDFTMTLAAKLEDIEVTLEHLLMDVFVSKPEFPFSIELPIIQKAVYKFYGISKVLHDLISLHFLINCV